MRLTFPGALTLIFVTLKLIGTIDWSWWWVLSPIWITIIVAFVVSFFWALAEEIGKHR